MAVISNMGILYNSSKAGADRMTESIAKTAESIGTRVITAGDRTLPEDSFFEGLDALCLIGGDGTLLNAVPAARKHKLPIFGINLGNLGFLSTLPSEEPEQELISILKGNYIALPRHLIACYPTNQPDKIEYGLNDVVIKHAEPSRLLKSKVYCNDELATTYRADGLIFSTSTGSTAYNLSSGGPIIHPGTAVFVMTPICPHTISNRSVVFGQPNVLQVQFQEPDQGVVIIVDGKNCFESTKVDSLSIELTNETIHLLKRKDYSHFEILRNKLQW